MIQVLQINKSYGRQQVLKNVCVSFSQGLIHGIVGRNGSGKTQLFKVICGYVLPDSGEVQVAGQRIGKDRRFPEKMGLLIESPGFLPGYSSLFNLQMLAAMNTREPAQPPSSGGPFRRCPQEGGQVQPGHAPAPGPGPGLNGQAPPPHPGRALQRSGQTGRGRGPLLAAGPQTGRRHHPFSQAQPRRHPPAVRHRPRDGCRGAEHRAQAYA